MQRSNTTHLVQRGEKTSNIVSSFIEYNQFLEKVTDSMRNIIFTVFWPELLADV
jgi:hypothetical protein